MKGFFNKSSVYKRLVKNASVIWGIPENEMESIDPLAKLLMGSIAKEIEKIGNELNNSDARIFKKQARYLMPDVLQSASPSHSVVQLNPVERTLVSIFDEFAFEKKWRNPANFNKVESQTILFTPVRNIEVSGLKLIYHVTSNGIHEIDGSQKEFISQCPSVVPHHDIILGIKKTAVAEDQKLNMFFNWAGEANKHALFNLLSGARIYCDNKVLESQHGIVDPHEKIVIANEFSMIHKIEGIVQHYYNKQFLSVTIPAKAFAESNELNELDKTVAEYTGKEESFVWIKLVLPPAFTSAQVQDASILNNCVPVINRKLNKSVFRLRKDANIRKLDFEGHFLDIQQIESSLGKSFTECPSIDMAEMSKGSYHARIGGVGRLDERDGAEYLNYMIDLLRDEKQAFSSLEITSTISDLEEIDAILRRVLKRATEAQVNSKKPYLIIRSFTAKENAHTHFWSTLGLLGNGIPTNTALQSSNPGLSQNGTVRMVSDSVGGHDDVDSKELIEKYKYSLLTRGAIVTRADIAQLCKSICGDALVSVEIKQGIVTSQKVSQGLMSTMDVHIDLGSKLAIDKQQFWLSQINNELELNSNFNVPVRIILKEHGKTKAAPLRSN